MRLETRCARLGRDQIAYQALGQGPLVLVNAPGSFSHADVVLEDPAAVLYYRRLASFAKVIHFDRRGTGGSDPTPPSEARPPWAQYGEELTAVLDAAGVEQAAILAMFDVGPMAISFAATNPDRVAALILANTSARHLAADDYQNSYVWIMKMRDGKVIDGTAFYDSLSFNDLWAPVEPQS